MKTPQHQRSSSAPSSIHRQFSLQTLVADDKRNSVADSATVNENGNLSPTGSTRNKKRLTDLQAVKKVDLQDEQKRMTIIEVEEEPEKPSIQAKQPYTVFSKAKVRWIVVLASIAAFFAPFSVNSYFPAMNTIESELKITSQQVNLTVTVFMIFQAISPSFWSALADTRGRRPVYLATLFTYILSNVGLALVTNYGLLLGFRMLQAFGAASVIAIGAGTIADVTPPSKRGGYIGWYSLGWNLGPVVGPAVGGVVSQYLGWRWIFWLLAIFGGAHWLVLAIFLPETLRSLVGNGSGYANPTPIQWWRHRKERKRNGTAIKATRPHMTWKQWLLGPLQPLMYAKEKDILILLVYYSVQYAACYTVTTSVPYLFSNLYGLNDMWTGLSYFPNGIGCIVGSIVQGKILNYDYRRMQQRLSIVSQIGLSDSSIPLERVRMRSTWFHAAIFNILLVVYGWCLYVKAHLAVILVIHFILGFTSQAIFNAIQTLLVDLYPKNSASITASNNIFRCLFGAAATTAILPGIQVLGVGWVFTVISGILLLSRIPMIFEVIYGPRWRRERAERLEVQQNKS